MYVVSSSRNEAIRKIISEKLSLLFGNFEIVKVSNFDPVKAAEYVAVRLPGYEIEPGILKFIIDISDGNPFYLDKIASEAGKVARERMTSFIGEETAAEAVLRLLYNSGGSIHQYLTSFILDLLDSRLKDSYVAALIAISEGKNKQADVARALKMKQADVAKLLLRLMEQGVISKNGAFYRIDDLMLAFWIKNVFDRRRKILIDGVIDKNGIFLNDIRAHIKAFIGESLKSADERALDLFGAFSNDLVQIDGKQVRLPHFTRVEIKRSADLSQFVSASFRGSYWLVRTYKKPVSENDVIAYIKNVKSFDSKVSSKIIIALNGIDDNSRLLAKELKIAVWDAQTFNTLLGIYGKKRIVPL
jgi:DNA-binding MarR family transcriptional regulator